MKDSVCLQPTYTSLVTVQMHETCCNPCPDVGCNAFSSSNPITRSLVLRNSFIDYNQTTDFCSEAMARSQLPPLLCRDISSGTNTRQASASSPVRPLPQLRNRKHPVRSGLPWWTLRNDCFFKAGGSSVFCWLTTSTSVMHHRNAPPNVLSMEEEE